MIRKLLIIVVVLGVVGAIGGGGLYYVYPVQVSTIAGLTRNYFISWGAPAGTTTTELNPDYKAAAPAAPSPPAAAPSPSAAAADWPSYNRTLASERYSDLNQINTKNVAKLKVLCTYDVDQYAAFESGLIMVEGALIGTTQFDIFSLDPATCAVNWRTHEDYPPALLPANRGAAYMDGMLFRGTQDGRVLAYDFKTGKRIWEHDDRGPQPRRVRAVGPDRLGRPRLRWQRGRRLQGRQGPHVRARRRRPARSSGSSFWFPKSRATWSADRWARRRSTRRPGKMRPASPSAAAGPGHHTPSTRKPGNSTSPAAIRRPTSSIGVREGDNSSTPLRSSCSTPRPETTRRHFQVVPKDWHDWDVSNPPVLIQTMGGKQLMAVAPKDGHLYGYDLANNSLLYRVPVTRVEDPP